MADITLQAINVCSGGQHVRLRVTVNGDPKATTDTEVSEIMATITQGDAARIAITLAQLVAIGRTGAQTKTALQNGVSFTV